jgi:hypothetical protein
MVWDGLGWFGMVWDGLGWFGMVWDGLGWCGMGLLGLVWSGLGGPHRHESAHCAVESRHTSRHVPSHLSTDPVW